jgi:hypothetical protein
MRFWLAAVIVGFLLIGFMSTVVAISDRWCARRRARSIEAARKRETASQGSGQAEPVEQG